MIILKYRRLTHLNVSNNYLEMAILDTFFDFISYYLIILLYYATHMVYVSKNEFDYCFLVSFI